MDNYYIIQVYKGLLNGKLADPIRPDKKYQLIATEDIGAYAVYAFEHPEKTLNRAVEIAGDELTNPQIAATFSRVMGREVKFKRLPMPVVRLFMGKEMYEMFRWFNEAGFQADIVANKKNYPEVRPLTLEQWLMKEGWSRWNKKGRF